MSTHRGLSESGRREAKPKQPATNLLSKLLTEKDDMSDPPEQPAERVMIPVYLRPKLAAYVHLLAADVDLTASQLIAALVEDMAKRGARAHDKHHVIVIPRRRTRSAIPGRQKNDPA